MGRLHVEEWVALPSPVEVSLATDGGFVSLSSAIARLPLV